LAVVAIQATLIEDGMARFDKLELGGRQEAGDEDAPPLREAEVNWLAEADRHRRNGQYENALRFYSRALEDDRSLVQAWLGQVQMLNLLDEWPEAELWSKKALELFPTNADLFAAQAQAVCRQGKFKRAVELSDGSLKQAGNSWYRWQVRGEVMLASKQETDRHCFDKAQQLEGDWLVPLEAALVYLHYRQPSKALPRAQRAVEKAADQYYAWYVQGTCQAQLDHAQSARQSFARCLELSPRHAEATARLVELEQRGWSPLRLARRLFGR
jgi:tetratricopeptide (TPR) repeat protein